MGRGGLREFMIFFCLALCFFPTLMTTFVFDCYAQPSSATVAVSPASITASVGQNMSIDVNISNVSDLYGWEFKLGWNASLLDLVSVDEGPFLKSGGVTFFTYYVNETGEHVVVDCTLQGDIPGVSGNGTLATATFLVESVGECPLQLYDVSLLSSSEMPIDCNAESGYGYFTVGHDVAVTSVSASPAIVVIGDIVRVNVTVQDQGGFAEVFNVTACANSQIIGIQAISLNEGSSATLTFVWNTTGVQKGDYEVSGSASVVPGEVNTTNNIMIDSDNVTLLYRGHDVAVIRVESSKTVVGQGFCMSVTATVKNYGVFNETFNTTAYANTTAIQTQLISLPSANSTTIIFTWNTTGFAFGNYTISAHAWIVPGETDTADNNCTDGSVIVSLAGDVTGPNGVPDGQVNLMDSYKVAMQFGSSAPAWDPYWGPVCDLNNDGTVNLKDYYKVCMNFGETIP
jgi:hypothetical protein